MTPEQATDLDLWRSTLAKRSDAMEARMDSLENMLLENTSTTRRVDENTKALVDILQSWQGAMKVFEFVGKLAKPLAAILTAIAAVWAMWPAKK